VRTLDQWLALQESVHARSIDLGLERVARVAQSLGLERPAYRIVTVGGTNGKGSTVAYLEALLECSGHLTGALTSPHLRRYNERIHLAGREAADAELIGAFERIEQARGTTTLTFFEYNTLAALLLFADRQVDVAVLEVGLGGRLDATNVVAADVAVLCSVGFDHRDWLGDTLEAIGREKAGIFRAGRPVVLGSPDMPHSVYAAIERLHSPTLIAERDFTWEVAAEHWTYRGPGLTLEELPPPPLAGGIQYRNAATALAALEALHVTGALARAQVAEAFARVRLAGRFQILPGPVEWVLDVAHNEPAARVLAESLYARPVRGRTHVVCGILRDKDAAAIGRALAAQVDEWILCTLPGVRGGTAAELAERLGDEIAPRILADSVATGCALARERAVPGDRVVVFGSFATVGAALEWLGLY
jgi:dihydrofolate synthase/folylpolyglutamate synthase